MKRTNAPFLLPALALAGMAGCAWEPQQNEAGVPDNVIAGTVVASGILEPTTTILFVTSADNPMPPLGTGRPVTLSTVTADAYTGDAAGMQAATYHVTGVPDGDFLVTGFMDLDGDFHPRVSAMAGATCGDVGGAHLSDLVTRQIAAVSVSDGELLDDVTVILGSQFPVERPAFYPLAWNATAGAYVPGRPVVSIGAAAVGNYQQFRLQSTAVHAQLGTGGSLFYDLDGPYVVQGERWDPFTGVPTCETAFYGWVKDTDANGFPDEHPDYPGTGLLDIWPRFGLTYLGKPVDQDLDGVDDGYVHDLPGEAWSSPAAVSPLSVLLTGELPVGVPFLTDWLDVLYVPAAQKSFRSAESACAGEWTAGTCAEIVQDPTLIPRGVWAITAISETGQTWTVPSELAGSVSTDEATFNPLTQFTWVYVVD